MGTVTFGDNAADIRTALGIGTAGVLDVGTSANNIVQLDGSGNLPAINGSAVTGLTDKFLSFDYASSSSQYTATNTTDADDSVLTLTVTPQSTNSKFLVVYNNCILANNNGVSFNTKIERTIGGGSRTSITGQCQTESSSSSYYTNHQMLTVDAPATTSQVVYYFVFWNQSGQNTVLSHGNTVRTSYLIEYVD